MQTLLCYVGQRLSPWLQSHPIQIQTATIHTSASQLPTRVSLGQQKGNRQNKKNI